MWRKAVHSLAWAANEADGSSTHNNEFDAMRHALWSALLTLALGADGAEAWTDAHEWGPLDPDEVCMDQHNNSVGRQIAFEVGGGVSDEELEDHVRDARDQRRLQLSPGC